MTFSRTHLTKSPATVVAIPAHNEAGMIERCLDGLARQQGAGPFAVVAYLNNCTDETASIARRLQGKLPYRLHVFDEQLPAERAHAGTARRIAMERAAALAAPDGVLMTTDADSIVAPDWIRANKAALDAGADAVAGAAEIDPGDEARLPRRLIEDEQQCSEYATLLDEMAWLLSPDPCDPWPRHTQHSGASIAVRAAIHHQAGGIPSIPLGEDRAFFAALRRVDARIRHAPDVTVTVSGRTVGRAKGGMADTVARRIAQPDAWLDDCLEPAKDRLRRLQLQAMVRQAWCGLPSHVPPLAAALGLPEAAVAQALAEPLCGEAWFRLEATSPVLRARPVPAMRLRQESVIARRIVATLRASCRLDRGLFSVAGRRSGTMRSAAGLTGAMQAVPAG